MNQFIYLSYNLTNETPLYGGKKGIKIVESSSIRNGDSANSKNISFNNHSGTHIDYPNHFIVNGKVSNDYSADFWVFNNPFLIEYNAKQDEIINLNKAILAEIPEKTDFLIIKTGFYKQRSSKKYWNNNPGFHPNLSTKLRKKCPNLKVLAMDCISLTSFQNRELGRKAHRKFLGENNILLVEDLKVDQLIKCPSKIYCFPILLDRVDGAPVTVIAEF